MADLSFTLAVEGPVKGKICVKIKKTIFESIAGWKAPPPELKCYVGIRVSYTFFSNYIQGVFLLFRPKNVPDSKDILTLKNF